jgi:hypothetical protein
MRRGEGIDQGVGLLTEGMSSSLILSRKPGEASEEDLGPHGAAEPRTGAVKLREREDKCFTFWSTDTYEMVKSTEVTPVIKHDYSLKNGVFWVVTPCGSCKNRSFGGTWLLLHQGDKNR